jgi:hypothetical protein
MRAGLVFLVASSTVAGIGQPVSGQEPRSPIDALLEYVEQDVRAVVPRDMRPYKISRLFLSVSARIPERGVLGSVGRGIRERFPVELVNDTITWNDMLVTGPGASARVRDDGVYVSIGAVDKAAQGMLAISFAYYVTTQRPGQRPAVCLEERRIVLAPPRAPIPDWKVAESKWVGGC